MNLIDEVKRLRFLRKYKLTPAYTHNHLIKILEPSGENTSLFIDTMLISDALREISNIRKSGKDKKIEKVLMYSLLKKYSEEEINKMLIAY